MNMVIAALEEQASVVSRVMRTRASYCVKRTFDGSMLAVIYDADGLSVAAGCGISEDDAVIACCYDMLRVVMRNAI